MSLLVAADLLRQYNKSPYGKNQPVNTTAASTGNKLSGTWSYANMYDALFDKYSQNKNFNINMWLDALRLGEQDTYLALLEQNRDTDLSANFYDSAYYNYERNMLELYKPFADATSLDDLEDGTSRERFQSVWDPTKGAWVEESLGKMTDRDYIDYQIQQADKVRAAEITRDLEQWRKDELGWWGQFGHDIAATLFEFGEGVLSALTGIVDFVAAVSGIGPMISWAKNGWEGNYADAFVDYFGRDGLTALEKEGVRSALDEYERTHTHFRDINGNMTGVGKYVAGIANSIGMMIPAIVINVATAGTAAPAWISTLTFYASIFSNNMYENANDPNRAGSPSWLKITNAAIKTGVEAVIEWGLGKMLGGTIQNSLIGLKGSVGKIAGKSLSKLSGWGYVLKSAAQEGLEEFLQDFSTNLVDQFSDLIYEGYGETGVTFQTLVDSFCIGALCSIFMSAATVPLSAAKSGDIYIETENGVQKLRGFNKMYFRSILSDFNEALKELDKKKMGLNHNLKLAQEVYAALDTIAQFYSSFDSARIKNCEMLLNRVLAAEETEINDIFADNKENSYAASILTSETVEGIVRDQVVTDGITLSDGTVIDSKKALNNRLAQVRALKTKTFAQAVSAAFNEMVGLAGTRHQARVLKAAEAAKEELIKNGVTGVTAVVDANGIHYEQNGKKDAEIQALEDRLGKKGMDKLDELRKDYEWVFVTDGHVAVEEDNMLFVSEAWLKNYQTSDVYRFLAQSKVLKNIINDTMLAPMVKEVIEFDEQFTKQENVTAEQAMMDLLFNKSVYQAFLLSNKGKNLFAYKNFIFRLHEIIKESITRSGYINWRGKVSEKRQNLANQIYEQIKLTMREPTIKAILNWNMDPQLIGADSVLTNTDKEFINQYKARQRVMSNNTFGPVSSAYQNIKNVLIAEGRFTAQEREAIEIGSTPDATDAQRLLALALLNEADRRMTTFDFEHGQKSFLSHKGIVVTKALSERMAGYVKGRSDADIETVLNEIYRCVHGIGKGLKGVQLESIRALETKIDEARKMPTNLPLRVPALVQELNSFFAQSLNKYGGKTQSSGAFSVPPQAFLNGTDLAEYIQFKADKINEFAQLYGVEARELMTGDITGMSLEQQKRMRQDMEVLGVDTYHDFVVRKLEAMLGPDFVVTTIYQDNGIRRNQFEFDAMDVLNAFGKVESTMDVIKHFFESTANWTAEMDTATLNLIGAFNDLAEYESNPFLREVSDYLYKHTTTESAKYLYNNREKIAQILEPVYERAYKESENERRSPADFEIVMKIDSRKLLIPDLIASDVDSSNFLFETFITPTEVRRLSDFLRLAIGPTDYSLKRLAAWNVEFVIYDDVNWAGETDTTNKVIRVNAAKSSDYVHTLVHEINHALQYEWHLTNGFNPNLTEKMPEFLNHVLNNYTDFVLYSMRRSYYDAGLQEIEKLKNEGAKLRVEYLSTETRKCVAYCAYRLVQGELYAEHYMHNGKLAKGYTMEQSQSNRTYLVSPDGKVRFEVPYNGISMHTFAERTDIATDERQASRSIAREMDNILYARANRSKNRKTYHTSLSRKSAIEVLSPMLSDNLSVTVKIGATINSIIADPEQYLSAELLAYIGNDLSEGNVYYRLKEYIESHFEGISIDRAENTHEYVLVDDNAFDDLFNSETAKLTDSKEHSLYEKYGRKEGISLGYFYSILQLARMGISSNVRVYISPDVSSETRFDKNNKSGTIFIKADENTTNEDLLNTLNHEFRHLMQAYNGFEMGFTPNFKVSEEMIADVKKHIPGLFSEDSQAKRWAQKYAGKNWEAYLVQQFVYSFTGGELNAYGISAKLLNSKPIYVTMEAGKPTIFMPWYDAKTGEGRFKTDFLAAREGEIEIPSVDKKKKYTTKTVKTSSKGKTEFDYTYSTRRDFSMKDAKGTNLEYFVKKGQRNQMDPDLQTFVKATTGQEDELPPEIMHAIKKGVLTKQALFRWFREVDISKINDTTFNLLNKTIFHNEYIRSATELDSLVTSADPSFFWAMAIVLWKEGMSLESFIKDNDVDKFRAFVEDVKGTKYKKQIKKLQTKFDNYWQLDENGKWKPEEIVPTDKILNYMRIFAMQYFDGTISGAVYMANYFRKVIRTYETEVQKKKMSLNTEVDDGKNGKKVEIGDNLSADDIASSDTDTSIGNDIIALYERDTGIPFDQMVDELIHHRYLSDVDKIVENLKADEKTKRIVKRCLLDRQLFNKNKGKMSQKLVEYITNLQMKLLKRMTDIQTKLSAMDYDEIAERYNQITLAEVADTSVPESATDVDAKGYSKNRVNIQTRIKTYATKIRKMIESKQISFKALPPDVQAMFDEKTLELKSETYQVGRGRNKLPGKNDTGRVDYVSKRNLDDGNEAFRHDVTKILANADRLGTVYRAINQTLKKQRNNNDRAVRGTIKEIGRIQKRAEMNQAIAQTEAHEKKVRETQITIKKKKRTSDTPNVFNIVSAIDMPKVLHDIFDISFEDMASTKVQFASKDEAGNLYDKETHGKEFDSRLKHEVSNWDAFYEANRTKLLALTRQDVLDIVEFFQLGMGTIDGPANKLAAFEIFLLGYIVDAGRRNISNWNLSNAELEMVEKLYEQKASEHGSGLNAVAQMLSTIDPYKKVRQRMLDEYGITDSDLQPVFDAVDALQSATDTAAREKTTIDLARELEALEARMVAGDTTKRGWFKRWWSKLKSYRYISMLSSLVTWVRNKVSNAIATVFNKTSDIIGKIVFLPKKGYRDGQWNLAGTQISNDVKAFIDEHIKKTVIVDGKKFTLFDAFYDDTSKYSERTVDGTKIKDERGLFVNMIVKAVERKYAANHRFDNKVANYVSQFVSKMISDKDFIKFATTRYFGKILTIEVDRGNVDLNHGLSNEVLNLFAESIILASQDYMHKRSFMANMIDGLKEKSPIAYEALTLWQPFLNSSFNWFLETLKYTPLGLINAIYRSIRLENQIGKIDAKRANGEITADSRAAEYLIRRDVGKGILGLVLSGLGAILALTGCLKIEDDDDKFYIVAGDVKVDISNIFGTSSVLIGASIVQHWVEKDDGTRAGFDETMRLVGEQMFEGFILKDLLARHKWDDGFYEGLLTETESVLRSFVPQVWQLIIRCTNNEKIKYSAGMAGMWERWLNTFVPTQPLGSRKINPYTGEIETKYAIPVAGEILKSGLLGPKIWWTSMSDEERFAREYGVNKNMLTGELTIDGEKQQLDVMALNKKYGELNKSSLAKIKSQRHKVKMPDGTFRTLSWDKMSDEQRANVISRTMTDNAELAKIYIWTQSGHKFYANNSLWLTLRQLGIMINVYKGDKGFVK